MPRRASTASRTRRAPATSAGVIRVGAIQTRIEFPLSIPFVIAGLTKVAVCLIAAAGAVRRVFGLRDAGSALIPVAVLSVGLSAVLADQLMDVGVFAAVHLRVAPLVQIGIPVLVWFVAELKRRRRPVEIEKT